MFNIIKNIHKKNRSIYGHYSKEFIVNRNKNELSYIPYSQFPFKYCPQYAYGGLIIITQSALVRIYKKVNEKRNYVWKEDVNLGIICNDCKINVSQIPNKVDIMLKTNNCTIIKHIIAIEIYNKYDNFFCV